MSDRIENPIAGSGHHSCPVPVVIGLVVEIRDGNHLGTSIWRRDDDKFPYVFVSHDKGDVCYAERCVLVRDLDVEEIPYGSYPYGCDLSTPEGLVLLGLDRDEDTSDLDWLKGSEILWDSAPKPTYLPQVGDRVVAERAFTDDEAVGIGWASHMQRFVGKTGTVERVDGHGDACVEFVDPGDGYQSWWWYRGALRFAGKE